LRRKIIAIIGDAKIDENSLKDRLAFEAGKAIIDAGYRLQCGGLGGIMFSACKGAHSSDKYTEGDIIGILPSFDANTANEYIDIAIPTGLDIYRNVIVAGASAVVAIGGGSGTLCEMTNAWALKRLLLGFSNCDGSSSRMAGTKLDTRNRYPEFPEDMVYPVTSAKEMISVINKYIDKYSRMHEKITFGV
jgi:uncharacterized protein (TIGR00725 family)